MPPLIADSGRQLLDQIWWDTRADRSCQVACCGFTSVGVLHGRVLESGSCYLDGPVAIGSFKSRLHAPNSLRSKCDVVLVLLHVSALLVKIPGSALRFQCCERATDQAG